MVSWARTVSARHVLVPIVLTHPRNVRPNLQTKRLTLLMYMLWHIRICFTCPCCSALVTCFKKTCNAHDARWSRASVSLYQRKHACLCVSQHIAGSMVRFTISPNQIAKISVGSTWDARAGTQLGFDASSCIVTHIIFITVCMHRCMCTGNN